MTCQNGHPADATSSLAGDDRGSQARKLPLVISGDKEGRAVGQKLSGAKKNNWSLTDIEVPSPNRR
jgi:hypothetical protein